MKHISIKTDYKELQDIKSKMTYKQQDQIFM